MEFSQLIRKRYSVRSYQPKQVEEADLNYVLECGRTAPTAANRQPQVIIAVSDEKGHAVLDKACNRFGAPTVLIVCADHNLTWKRSFDEMDSAHVDASIITDHMMLAAADRGLGSLWICKFDPEVIRNGFSLPDNVEPVNLLCLGYADDQAENSAAASPDRHKRLRKPLEETVYRETYSRKDVK